MRFRVPQFIDIEDKIFGPFTFKQFIYLAGGAGLSYIFFKTLPLYIAVILILPTASLALALTFIKVNSKPFIDVLQSFFIYLFQSKLYIWTKKVEKTKPVKESEKTPSTALGTGKYAPKLTESRLKDVAWSLDILDMRKK